MKDTLIRQLADAGRLTRGGRLADATRIIRDALAAAASPSARTLRRAPQGDVIDVVARELDDEPRPAPASTPRPAPRSTTEHTDAHDGAARFVAGRFGNAAGLRDYKLFIPAGAPRRGLIVMLHGCTQDPDDFATGTRMNVLAGAQGLCVLYPAQAKAANNHGCWNWFREGDQQRDRGEPSILAGMTRQVIAQQTIDPHRVYVAGLSAGGAMAVTLGAVYPELFAAVGVHSGLPRGAANDLPSALSAMLQGAQSGEAGRTADRPVPTIVFHGDRDTTVHPCNGEQVLSQALSGSASDAAVEHGQVPAGHRYTRTVHRDAAGGVDAEHWLLHGAGHAWSGGDPRGSHTDARGPDASAQMLRFFLQQTVTRR